MSKSFCNQPDHVTACSPSMALSILYRGGVMFTRSSMSKSAKKVVLILLVSGSLTLNNLVVHAQVINLKQKELSLDLLFSEIRKQTGYDFVYATHQFNTSRKVKITSSRTTLKKLLDDCFSGQQISYLIRNKTIIIKGKVLTGRQK